MLKPRSALVFVVTCVLAAGGCDKTPANSTASATNSAPATAQRGIPDVMQDTAAALRDEEAVLRLALQSLDSVSEADTQAYWAALQRQRSLADELQAIIDANPMWVSSVCEWYASQIQQPYDAVVRLRNALHEKRSGGERSDHLQLLLNAAGSESAAREYIGIRLNHPATPTNLYIMCVKFGFVEEE